MGYRLHVAKTYKVEWDLDGMFNYKSEQINTLIGELCPNAFFSGEDKSFSERIEIDKDEFEDAIQTIVGDTEYYDRLLKSRGISYTADEFAGSLLHLLKASDKQSDIVILEWF